MKVGDMVKQVQPKSTVPLGALGIIVEEEVCRLRGPSRYTVHWIVGNKRDEHHVVSETVGYGYGYEVISES